MSSNKKSSAKAAKPASAPVKKSAKPAAPAPAKAQTAQDSFEDKLKAFTRTKIYLTEPQYNGQLLEKTLLSSFTTNVLNIANYEGMCLGPEINGKPSLLLLADSQDGAGGLTKEYLQIILIHL